MSTSDQDLTSQIDALKKHGCGKDHIFVDKASGARSKRPGHGPKNRFYRATRELGRVFKTKFILDYLSQPALRTRIRRGLLKGEQLHALARGRAVGREGGLLSV